MFHIGIYEENVREMQYVKKALDFYVVTRNTAFELTWFTDEDAPNKVVKYVADFHLVLISLKAKGFRSFCHKVYATNRRCRICGYLIDKTGQVSVSEPLQFIDDSGGEEAELQSQIDFSRDIDRMISDLCSAGSILKLNTRQMLHLIPVEDVIYICSDLKYIMINMRDGNTVSAYKKLDEIEALKIRGLVRTHKSYIVNSAYVTALDKAERLVILKNSESLPISTSRYREVLEYFAQSEAIQ